MAKILATILHKNKMTKEGWDIVKELQRNKNVSSVESEDFIVIAAKEVNKSSLKEILKKQKDAECSDS